ncbi:MAG: GNAT family N-acetyltransferase [Lachnospiraceae bacterium]|nr:GNAT family N-acetyltransferase [Lachnospiraceae bacterium]
MEPTKLVTIFEWQNILSEFKNEHGRCETNCYLSENAVNEYISCGRMSYIVKDDTLWMLEAERGYDIAYYYVVRDKSISCIGNHPRKQILYLIGSEDKYRAQNREKQLIRGGYRKYRKNLEYFCDKEALNSLIRADRRFDRYLERFGFHYEWMMNDTEYDELYELWRNRIDQYSVKYAVPSTIQRLINNKECMIVKDGCGEIVAACQYEINNSRGFSENIAVAERYNGAGIGAVLLTHSVLFILEHAESDMTYVWEKNLESRRISEKFCRLTGRFSQQLIM